MGALIKGGWGRVKVCYCDGQAAIVAFERPSLSRRSGRIYDVVKARRRNSRCDRARLCAINVVAGRTAIAIRNMERRPGDATAGAICKSTRR